MGNKIKNLELCFIVLILQFIYKDCKVNKENSLWEPPGQDFDRVFVMSLNEP